MFLDTICSMSCLDVSVSLTLFFVSRENSDPAKCVLLSIMIEGGMWWQFHTRLLTLRRVKILS